MSLQPSIWRRLLQFNLRTLLLIVLVVAIALTVWREQKPMTGLPIDWNPGKLPRSTVFGSGVPPQSRNIKWSTPLGSWRMRVSHKGGAPVVSGGRVFIGTNNMEGYLPRYPADQDFGVLLCFAENDGTLLWQATTPKLKSEEDFPLAGVASTPVVSGERLWYVNNRAEVVCLDTAGFHDGENDGPVVDEIQEEPAYSQQQIEADVIWKFDMRAELGVYVHELSYCRPATDGKRLFVVTGNSVDRSHINIPNPTAPSFIALDRQTGRLLWTDNSPGANIMHTQWGSPTYAVIGHVPQVIFPGGDGWLYSFDPAGGPQGKSKLLWKFDLNPKASFYALGGRGTRNDAFFVTVDGHRVFAIGGQDPEHGEGQSILWCIDGTKRGDVSAELAVQRNAPTVPLLPRLAAIDADLGEIAVPNPNSAVVWKFDSADLNHNGAIELEETICRTRGAVVVQDGVALVADYGGRTHCFDAQTGKRQWMYDSNAACWSPPLIAGRHAYVCNEDGEVAIFELFPKQPGKRSTGTPVAKINMRDSIYNQPAASNGVLFIATRSRLFAIENAKPKK